MSVSILQSRPVFPKRGRPKTETGFSDPIEEFLNKDPTNKIDVVYIHRSMFLDWGEIQRNPAFIDSKAFAKKNINGQFEHGGNDGEFIGAFFDEIIRNPGGGGFVIRFSVPFDVEFKKSAPVSLLDASIKKHGYELIVRGQEDGSPAVFKTGITAAQFKSNFKERFPIEDIIRNMDLFSNVTSFLSPIDQVHSLSRQIYNELYNNYGDGIVPDKKVDGYDHRFAHLKPGDERWIRLAKNLGLPLNISLDSTALGNGPPSIRLPPQQALAVGIMFNFRDIASRNAHAHLLTDGKLNIDSDGTIITTSSRENTTTIVFSVSYTCASDRENLGAIQSRGGTMLNQKYMLGKNPDLNIIRLEDVNAPASGDSTLAIAPGDPLYPEMTVRVWGLNKYGEYWVCSTVNVMFSANNVTDYEFTPVMDQYQGHCTFFDINVVGISLVYTNNGAYVGRKIFFTPGERGLVCDEQYIGPDKISIRRWLDSNIKLRSSRQSGADVVNIGNKNMDDNYDTEKFNYYPNGNIEYITRLWHGILEDQMIPDYYAEYEGLYFSEFISITGVPYDCDEAKPSQVTTYASGNPRSKIWYFDGEPGKRDPHAPVPSQVRTLQTAVEIWYADQESQFVGQMKYQDVITKVIWPGSAYCENFQTFYEPNTKPSPPLGMEDRLETDLNAHENTRTTYRPKTNANEMRLDRLEELKSLDSTPTDYDSDDASVGSVIVSQNFVGMRLSDIN